MLGKLTKLCAVALLFGAAQMAHAQYVGGYAAGAQPYYGGNGGYGWGWNNWGAGSTVAGSYLEGMGSAIRAEGQYNLNTSAAAINIEEANKRDIENRVRWTKAYFEMRSINESYRHPKRPPPPPETWVRLAQAGVPARLPSTVLDPLTGAIAWPSALVGEEFKADREVLEDMFIERARAHGAIGSEGHAKIRAAVEDALAKLKARIKELDSRTYLEARNFLNSLAHEANFPTA